MADPFIGEIRIFAGSFAPRDWTFCNGGIMPVAQNTALFSILGTTYGGDGRTSFGLPNLQGRAPMGAGTGPGLTPRQVGHSGGGTTATLNLNQIPAHNHPVFAHDNVEAANPTATRGLGAGKLYGTPNSTSQLDPDILGSTGQGTEPAHNNMQPYLVLQFIIALAGVFPSRN